MSITSKVNAAREARLWISGVIIPIAGIAVAYFSNPENQQKAKNFVDNTKNNVVSKFNKTKSRVWSK